MDEPIDILFPGCNRLEYTRETLSTLQVNTDWSLVGKLYLYDDQSEDGTREYLEQAAQDIPVDTVFHTDVFNCPLAILVHAIRRSTAPLFAKVDSDTMMPPGWLNVAKGVMDENADLDLLGLAFRAGETGDAATDTFTYTESPFIGGIGLFRRQVIYDWYDDPLEALKAKPRLQRTLKGIDQSHMKTGWLVPNLPIFFLDHIPFQPWLGYGKRYVEQGWQRKCSKYDPELSEKLWGWWKR